MANTIIIKYSDTPSNIPTLAPGEIAINRADGKLFWKDSSNVIKSMFLSNDAIAAVSRDPQVFTATAGQTAFTVSAYTVGQGLVDVFFNGAWLAPAEYTETNSTTITLVAPAALNDIIGIITYDEASVSGMTEELLLAYSIVL